MTSGGDLDWITTGNPDTDITIACAIAACTVVYLGYLFYTGND